MVTAADIYLYVPNLIGYVRVLTTIGSYYVAPTQPGLCLALYTTGFVLDAADGHAARLLNQSTSFGAVFDMLIDRAATSGFLVILAQILGGPTWSFIAALLIALDLASHYARMYMSLALGLTSHKDTGKSRFWLLSQYYGKKAVMLPFCLGQESVYLLMYAQAFYGPSVVPDTALWALFPLFALKQVCNVLQLLDAMANLADKDAAERNARAGGASANARPSVMSARR
jgi:CDP-diacylglycerol--inositol 3-phosphatidyltransferase